MPNPTHLTLGSRQAAERVGRTTGMEAAAAVAVRSPFWMMAIPPREPLATYRRFLVRVVAAVAAVTEVAAAALLAAAVVAVHSLLHLQVNTEGGDEMTKDVEGELRGLWKRTCRRMQRERRQRLVLVLAVRFGRSTTCEVCKHQRRQVSIPISVVILLLLPTACGGTGMILNP